MSEKKFEFKAESSGVLRATETKEKICLDVKLSEMKPTCFVRLFQERGKEPRRPPSEGLAVSWMYSAGAGFVLRGHVLP
jgi:hypothetical protein